ncbi:MAG: BlaI/MecI/CopY family transcriptional regulator [Planctomycetota bacterium]|jgi:predicted transcriptional regulator
MAPRPAPSKGELEVARVLWSLGKATPRQVFEAYPNQRNLDFATVQTYLRRLESKGYIDARREGRTKLYRPRVRPGTVIRKAVDDLVDRLFDGETLSLMCHLMRDRRISDEEILQLRELLRQLEAEQDESSR